MIFTDISTTQFYGDIRKYRWIFWLKISIGQKSMKTSKYVENNSKNDIINNNKYFKVVLSKKMILYDIVYHIW